MKKKTFLKSLSFTSLALLMGAAGVFSFAPLGATPIVATANEMVDHINTTADGENIKYAPSALGLDPENDPVIYTTESGLEIKYGGATTALGGGNEKNDFAAETLPSGKPLSGYPYFTMGTYNGYAVNWVIIGKSTTGIPTTSTSTGMSDYNYEKLSTWQGKTSESPTYKHFFEQTYEATTPAGAAIKNSGTLNNYAARKIEYMFNPSILSSIVSHEEISSGCVLAISECCLASTQFYSSNTNNKYEDSILKTLMNQYYTSTLNLTETQKKLIQKQSFNTDYVTGSASGSSFTWQSARSYDQYIFSLAHRTSEAPTSLANQEFMFTTYLNSDSLRIAYSIGTTTTREYWTRSGRYHVNDVWLVRKTGVIDATDTNNNNVDANSTLYSRPACVVKFA